MKTAKRLLTLALAGVMMLALLTGCSDSGSQAKQVEEYFRYMNGGYMNYQKDETLDKKLEVIAQQFLPDWLDDRNGGLTEDARNIIRDELSDYVIAGGVTPWVGEVKPGQSALAQAESMEKCRGLKYDASYGSQPLYAIAFTMTGEKSDGHRYYLALVMEATVKTPQT